MLCKICGAIIEPAYVGPDGLCEACFSDNAARWNLPSAVTFASRSEYSRKAELTEIEKAVYQ